MLDGMNIFKVIIAILHQEKIKKQLLKGPYFQCLWPGREEGNSARCTDNSEKINKYVVTLTSVNNPLIQNRIVCLSV